MKDTLLLTDIADLQSGTPQFRIDESTDPSTPVYEYYTQTDLEADFWQVDTPSPQKQVRTTHKVTTLNAGDTLFSLISGKAVRVQAIHTGRLYTQNYIKLTPKSGLDANYLVYLLNENTDITRQLGLSLQGSQVMKYTVKQLKELILPALPSLIKQRLIGEIYMNMQRIATLKKRVADYEHRLILEQLKGVKP